ncbi:maleylpyruvate isomerase family mycothiol-dependent enzyme [Streptomyces sp. NPDC085942]|uniref:maleylpyruvate isomerase family mycothiol-dependent enzyme n=1 Tax=Streptomyces sp. NPDC085942 TaxID=3365743 RepID=UPI0037D561C6
MTDTTRGPAPDPAHHLAYRACRENITRLVTSDLSVAELPVPACPGWNVGDLVSHLVLVCRMAVDEYPGELSDPPPPPQGIPVHELVVTWAELEEHLPGVLARADWLRRRILPLDVLSHELDLRAALGLPPPDGSPALADALDLAVGGFALSLHERGLPTLRVRTPDREWTAGEGEPAATLCGGSLDVFRSLTGRRTVRQIAELYWSTSPASWLPAFTWGPFTPPTRAVEEAGPAPMEPDRHSGA